MVSTPAGRESIGQLLRFASQPHIGFASLTSVWLQKRNFINRRSHIKRLRSTENRSWLSPKAKLQDQFLRNVAILSESSAS